MKRIINFFKEEDGATAVEYAVMVALIAAVVIGTVQVIGTNSNDAFNAVSGPLDAATP